MGAAAECLAQVVGDGSDVGAGTDAGAEVNPGVRKQMQLEFVNRDRDRGKLDLLMAAGELVGRDTFDFLRGKGRRKLLDGAKKAGIGFPYPMFINCCGTISGGLS